VKCKDKLDGDGLQVHLHSQYIERTVWR